MENNEYYQRIKFDIIFKKKSEQTREEVAFQIYSLESNLAEQQSELFEGAKSSFKGMDQARSQIFEIALERMSVKVDSVSLVTLNAAVEYLLDDFVTDVIDGRQDINWQLKRILADRYDRDFSDKMIAMRHGVSKVKIKAIFKKVAKENFSWYKLAQGKISKNNSAYRIKLAS